MSIKRKGFSLSPPRFPTQKQLSDSESELDENEDENDEDNDDNILSDDDEPVDVNNISHSPDDVIISSIPLLHHCFEICWHPNRCMLAVALITGEIQLYKIVVPPPIIIPMGEEDSDNENNNNNNEKTENSDESDDDSDDNTPTCPHTLLHTFTTHTASARSLEFNSEGTMLYSCSADCSIACYNISTMKCISHWQNAHPTSINKIRLYNDQTLISGDDNGFVKIWDLRKNNSSSISQSAVPTCVTFEESGDYISDICICTEKHKFFTTSGDGYLYVFDMRGKYKSWASSECQDDDLNNVIMMKNNRKVLTASKDGLFSIFKWDYFGIPNDHFRMKRSIDTLIKINDDLIVIGSNDGRISCVSVHPNKVLGIVGAHSLPIEHLALSKVGLPWKQETIDAPPNATLTKLAPIPNNLQMLASVGHDNSIKFWDVTTLVNTTGIADEESEEEEEAEDGEQEEMEDDEEDDEEDEEEEKSKSKLIVKGQAKAKEQNKKVEKKDVKSSNVDKPKSNNSSASNKIDAAARKQAHVASLKLKLAELKAKKAASGGGDSSDDSSDDGGGAGLSSSAPVHDDSDSDAKPTKSQKNSSKANKAQPKKKQKFSSTKSFFDGL